MHMVRQYTWFYSKKIKILKEKIMNPGDPDRPEPTRGTIIVDSSSLIPMGVAMPSHLLTDPEKTHPFLQALVFFSQNGFEVIIPGKVFGECKSKWRVELIGAFMQSIPTLPGNIYIAPSRLRPNDGGRQAGDRQIYDIMLERQDSCLPVFCLTEDLDLLRKAERLNARSKLIYPLSCGSLYYAMGKSNLIPVLGLKPNIDFDIMKHYATEAVKELTMGISADAPSLKPLSPWAKGKNQKRGDGRIWLNLDTQEVEGWRPFKQALKDLGAMFPVHRVELSPAGQEITAPGEGASM